MIGCYSPWLSLKDFLFLPNLTHSFELIFQSFFRLSEWKLKESVPGDVYNIKKPETKDEKTSVLGYLRMSKLEQIFKKVITTKKDSTSQFWKCAHDYSALNKWKVMKSLGEALYKHDKEKKQMTGLKLRWKLK